MNTFNKGKKIVESLGFFLFSFILSNNASLGIFSKFKLSWLNNWIFGILLKYGKFTLGRKKKTRLGASRSWVLSTEPLSHIAILVDISSYFSHILDYCNGKIWNVFQRNFLKFAPTLKKKIKNLSLRSKIDEGQSLVMDGSAFQRKPVLFVLLAKIYPRKIT